MIDWIKFYSVSTIFQSFEGIYSFHIIIGKYIYSKEKPLSPLERFGVWLGVLEKPKPCPGVDDLYAVSQEDID